MRAAIAALALAASATACTWHAPVRTWGEISCQNKAHCDRVWGAAQIEIVNRSTFRLQIANESVIQTYGPNGGDFAYEATRTINPDGTGVILVRALCFSTVYGCVRDPSVATQQLTDTLRAVR